MIDWTKWKLVPVEATDAMLCAALEQASVEIQYDGSTTIADAEYTLQQLITDAIAAALAELEKAAAEPVAWMYDKGDEEGLVTPFNPLTTPGHGGRKNIRPLYAAPPAPVAEIREPTPEECERISMAYYDDEALVDRDHRHLGRDIFRAVRAVMFPQKSEVL